MTTSSVLPWRTSHTPCNIGLTSYDLNSGREVTRIKDAHSDEVFTIDFNPHNEHTYVTGSKDASIILWDLRKPDFKLHSFENHAEAVSSRDLDPQSGMVSLRLRDLLELQ